VHVVSVEVSDFRSYTNAEVSFGPGCSVLVGANGQGKTNLVEAIGYAAALRSHRVATDAPLVRIGAQQAVVRVVAQRAGRRATLELAITPGKGTRARLNSSPLPRAREALGLVRAVTFAPEDLALVKGDPAVRRDFLDDLLVQRQPRWSAVMADFDRVLRQRAALLRSVAKRGGRAQAEDQITLEVWDSALAELGGQLWWARQDLLQALSRPFDQAYRTIAGADAATSLTYRSSALAGVEASEEPHGDHPAAAPMVPPQPADLQRLLARALPLRHAEEFRRGVNLTGPQRDDVMIGISGHPAKGYASHGESWSLALALRLAAYRLLSDEAVDEGDPVLILDDVFAELDGARRERLAAAVAGAEQVLVTAAVAGDVPPALAGAWYQVADGSIVQERA
jgi:DNA replication and repair protein RecF